MLVMRGVAARDGILGRQGNKPVAPL